MAEDADILVFRMTHQTDNMGDIANGIEKKLEQRTTVLEIFKLDPKVDSQPVLFTHAWTRYDFMSAIH